MNEKILIKHMEEDARFQEDTRIVHAEFLKKVEVLEKKMEGVATKEDIKEVLEFMKTLNVGLGIFRFSWNNASKIGIFVLFIGGLIFAFKAAFAAFIGVIFGRTL